MWMKLTSSSRSRSGRWAGAAAGGMLAAIGLEMFLIPHGLVAGGTIGISTFLAFLSGAKLAWIMLSLQLFLLLAFYKPLSRMLDTTTIVGLIVLSVALFFLHPLEPWTANPLLAAMMGGALIGGGAGLAYRRGSLVDLASLLVGGRSRLPRRAAMLIFNGGLLLIVALLFGWERAFYSMLSVLAAMEAMKLLLRGYPAWRMLWISSSRALNLQEEIGRSMNPGIVLLSGTEEGSFHTLSVVLCKVHRFEEEKLVEIVEEIDPYARICSAAMEDQELLKLVR